MQKKVNSRRKGHSFERTVATDLKKHGFPNAKRHLEYQSEEAKGVDLDHTGPFAVQCKSLKKTPNIPEVMKEIDFAERVPVIVFSVTGKGKFMAFRYEDALHLMQAFSNNQKSL